MSSKIYTYVVSILLASLALLTYFSTAHFSNQETPYLSQNIQVYRELKSTSYTPFGNQVKIEINDSHFQQNQIINLIIELKNDSFIYYNLIYDTRTYYATIDVNCQLISKITITNKRSSPRNQPRIIQTITTDSAFLNYMMYGFQLVLPVCRNLTIIGLLFNLLDIFLPFIIFCQSFTMFAFFNTDLHYLNSFYFNIFNSKFDLMNAIRLTFSNGSDTNTLAPLSQYNFSSNLFINISGQFFVTIIFLAITVFVAVLAFCCNSQRFRTIKTRLHPLWNGYFMAIMPRLATLMGFHFRIIVDNEINIFLASVISLSFIIYFIQLLVQTRRVNSKFKYIQESKVEIGLVLRINYREDFQFDCLNYSMLYYPLMNFVRLLVFFVPIGAAYDLYYISFGGAIISQLFMMMIEVSSPGYTSKRDKFMYPLNNFLLLTMELCIITISLAQSVSHPQVSQITQIVLFSIAICLFTNSLICLLIDTLKGLRHRCYAQSQKNEELQENGTQQFGRKVDQMQSELDEKVIRKTLRSDDENDDFNEDELQKHRTGFSKQNSYRNQIKIKKVRRGIMI